MKIDIHAHVADRLYFEELADVLEISPERGDNQTLIRKNGTTISWFTEDFFDEPARIAAMESAGIDWRILSLSSPGIYQWPQREQPRMARRINTFISDYTRRHPDRFLGLASLPLSDPQGSIDELIFALDELGLVGAAMPSHANGLPLNHPSLEPVWEFINSRQVLVVQHPMQPLGADHLNEFELPIRVGFVYETTTALTRMIYAGLFERYPDFPFVAAHTGGSVLTLLARLDNGYRLFPDCRRFISKPPSDYARKLYYDTCCFFPPMLDMAARLVGAERLLWGSDEPYIGASMAHVEAMTISAQDRAKILGGNAAALLGLKTEPRNQRVLKGVP